MVHSREPFKHEDGIIGARGALTPRFCKYRNSSGLDDVIAHGPLASDFGHLLHLWQLSLTSGSSCFVRSFEFGQFGDVKMLESSSIAFWRMGVTCKTKTSSKDLCPTMLVR